MHFAITDDMTSDRERLKEAILSGCAGQNISADCSLYESGEAFLADFKPGYYDAVFLDIIMPGKSGIEVAKQIRAMGHELPLIFTTTEKDFALDGYEVHAMDYLIKPIQADKVFWCLQQLKRYQSVPSHIEVRAVLGRGVSVPQPVALDDIFYGEYEKHSVCLHTASGIVRTTLSFGELEELLPKSGRFLTCNRGILVNLSQVGRVEQESLLLSNGERLPISRRRHREILEAFAAYTFEQTRKGGWR